MPELDSDHPAHDAGYRGPADITVRDEHATVDVQLSGRFDPLRGRHVWRGRLRNLSGSLPPGIDLSPGTEVTIAVPGSDEPALARITETDLWGSHMVDGISRPPYGEHPA